jgi:hypothetical protein
LTGIVWEQKHDFDQRSRTPKTKIVESVMPDPGDDDPFNESRIATVIVAVVTSNLGLA